MLTRHALVGLAALFALASTAPTRAEAQGVTTGGVTGTVTDASGRPIPEVQVEIRNPTTGFSAGVLTRPNGQYQFLGLQPDAYVLTVRRVGYTPVRRDPVRVTLGQITREDISLTEQAATLEAMTVSGTVDPVINASKAGTGTTVSDSALSRLPTLNRNFADFVQLVPQVSTTTGFLSGGGVNVRQNAIQIDGAQAGDLFGLGTTGQPGGQANAKSIPLDAVKEYQVLLSPFDIRQGNFGGLLINAVTRGGTNTYKGTAYVYTRDQKLTRQQEYLNDFTQQQYGFSVGGPIVKDKVFFFLNPEFQRTQTPASGPYIGSTNPPATVSQATIDQFSEIASTYGLTEPGSGVQVQRENPTRNIFARVDAYLPLNTRLVLRHNYASADNTVFGRSNPASSTTPNFNLTSNRYEFSNTTNSTVLELLTTTSSGIFNEFLVNRSEINDFRTVPVRFPQITVQNLPRADVTGNTARIVAGTEASSQGNSLDQVTFELTNNLTIPFRSHAFTIGAKLINYEPTNLFAQNSLGSWTFTSMANFQNGIASNYVTSAPAPTDPAGGLANFRASNLSLYMQDRWQVRPNLTVTGGVRYDKPDFADTPPENPTVLTDYGRNTSVMPSTGQFSPRIAFNWDVLGDGTNQLRGGIGYFTGSVPFVYLSNAFGNSGLSGYAALTCNGSTSGTFSQLVPQFNAANIGTPPTRCADQVVNGVVVKQGATVALGGSINTVDPDFKFPQYQKMTLGYDRRLPWGMVGTLEGLATRSVNNAFYTNLALKNDTVRADNGRLMYGNLTATGAAPVYQGSRTVVLDATNSSGDYIWSLTGQLQKSFTDNFEGSLAYTYQRAEDVTTTTSSTAGSNYRYQRSVSGDILSKALSRSKNDQPHRFIATGTYSLKTKTDLSFVYTGNSGAPFDFVYGSSSGTLGDLNADGQTQNDLLYVPTTAEIGNGRNGSAIRFTGWNGNAAAQASAEQQAAAFDKYIDSIACLRESRGQIMERNACRNPWINQVDVSIAQSLSPLGTQRVQLRLDIINFGNFLNKDWGAQAFSDQGSTCGQICSSTVLVTHTGSVAPTGVTLPARNAIPVVTYNTTYKTFNQNNASSNYRMQLSLRYSF
jgi:outer membrane receptor protein involved in Fe transport